MKWLFVLVPLFVLLIFFHHHEETDFSREPAQTGAAGPAGIIANLKGTSIPAAASSQAHDASSTTASQVPDKNSDLDSANSFESVLQALPKITDGQKLKAGEAHQMPQELLARFETLIKVNRAIRNNPQLEAAGLKFYEQCATREDLMNAVRARCLTHLRSLAKKRGESVDLTRYSARLVRLSEFISL